MFHLGNTIISKINLIFNIFLKSIKRYLVSIFKFSIIFCILLNSIICQMNLLIIRIIFIKLIVRSRCSYIAFFKEIAFAIMINKHPYSYVEFSFLYQIWIFNILLNYKTVKLKYWLLFCFLFFRTFFFLWRNLG